MDMGSITPESMRSAEHRTYGNASVSNFSRDVNSSNSITFVEPFDSPYIRGIYIFLFGAIFAGCILGNISVIYVILCHKKMRNVTNFFLANLAVSDLCVGVFCVLPNLSMYLSTIWYLGPAMCKMYYFIQCMSYTASVLILTVISLERYFAIIHPMLNRRISRMYVMKSVIVAIWILAGMYSVPNLMAYDTIVVPNRDNYNITVQFCVNSGNWSIDMEMYSVFSFILLYLVPLFLITIIYTIIAVVLWKSSNSMRGQSQQMQLIQGNEMSQCGTWCQIKCQNCCRSRSLRETGKSNRDSSPSNYRNCIAMLPQRKRPSLLTHDRRDSSGQSTRICACSGDKSTHPMRRGTMSANLDSNHDSISQCRCSVTAAVSRRKVIRLLVCIIVTFALCVLPHHVRVLWQFWHPHGSDLTFGHMLIPPSTFLFFYLNSALNPFLYALLSDHFRTAFSEVFTRCGRSNREMTRMTTFRESRYRQGSLYSNMTPFPQTATFNSSPRGSLLAAQKATLRL